MTLFPVGFLGHVVKARAAQYLLLLLAGLPIYICSTGSLPLAFSLYWQGFSPGAILVFLLSGPASNITSLVLIRKTLGPKVFWLYLTSVICFALGAGVVLDLFSPKLDLKPPLTLREHFGLGHIAAALVLGLLLLRGTFRKRACRPD